MKRSAGSMASASCDTCGHEHSDPGRGQWTGANAMAVGKKHAKTYGHKVNFWQENTGFWDYTEDGPRHKEAAA